MPNLRVVLQSVHCSSNLSLGVAFNKLNSGCSSQHLLNSYFPIVAADSVVEVFPELAKSAVINSDQAVGKMPLTFLVTSKRGITYGTNCESHQHTSPKQNKKKVTMEAVN